jgi:hypothetical protein
MPHVVNVVDEFTLSTNDLGAVPSTVLSEMESALTALITPTPLTTWFATIMSLGAARGTVAQSGAAATDEAVVTDALVGDAGPAARTGLSDET